MVARNAAVENFKSVPHGIDARTYFTAIPVEVRRCVPLLHEMETPVFRAIVSACVDQLRLPGGAANERVLRRYAQLRDAAGLDDEQLGLSYSGIYSMLRTAVRQRTALGTVRDDLTSMRVPDAMVSDLVAAIRASRAALEDAALENRVRYPRCDGLRWRVDVTISTGQLSRVMRPSILMQMCLSDGRIHTFEVGVEAFHQLRYAVAKALRSMQELERHPIMRLAFDQDRADFDRDRHAG